MAIPFHILCILNLVKYMENLKPWSLVASKAVHMGLTIKKVINPLWEMVTLMRDIYIHGCFPKIWEPPQIIHSNWVSIIIHLFWVPLYTPIVGNTHITDTSHQLPVVWIWGGNNLDCWLNILSTVFIDILSTIFSLLQGPSSKYSIFLFFAMEQMIFYRLFFQSQDWKCIIFYLLQDRYIYIYNHIYIIHIKLQ